jgi:hypothetical protein
VAKIIRTKSKAHGAADFNAALDKGELTAEANVAIAAAFDEVFERNLRLANIFLADKDAREEVTKFWFARAYAEVQASKVYNDAFRRALSAKSRSEQGGANG